MTSRKPLWKVSVDTTLESEDAVAELLSSLFHSPASSYFDFEARISRVTVYLTGKAPAKVRQNVREGLARIRNCGLETGTEKISIAKVRREDWAESWKRHFQPIEIGNSILVKPGWSKKRPLPGQVVVVMDPGLSFGTGQHPTTAYCLKEIVRHSNLCRTTSRSRGRFQKSGQSFLDIGTGSGILAISAAKLGYEPVCAMDFDPEAVRAARANARMNGVKIGIVRGDIKKRQQTPKERFNLICANLISDLLVSESERIMALLENSGRLVLSGILKSEFSVVRRKYEEAGLKLVSAKSEGEWRSGSFVLCNFF